jgi:hypothetical protein
MAVTGTDDDADATKCTGDPEADAGKGEVTVILANEAALIKKITNAIVVTLLATLIPSQGNRVSRYKVSGQNLFVLISEEST